MDAAEIRQRALTVVAEMAPLWCARPNPSTRLREDLGYDSLSLLELAAALEDEFDLPPTAELDAQLADTAGDVERIVLEQLGTAC
jgi:acyl carrier protein